MNRMIRLANILQALPIVGCKNNTMNYVEINKVDSALLEQDTMFSGSNLLLQY
jgi:hypothetical protein